MKNQTKTPKKIMLKSLISELYSDKFLTAMIPLRPPSLKKK